jgi:hypothetical protein
VSDEQYVWKVASDLNNETWWTAGVEGGFPTVRPQTTVSLDQWMGRGGTAATFEPPADAQPFTLSGMNDRATVTVTTSDRRTAGMVIFAGLVVIALLTAAAGIGLKMAVLTVLVAGALFAAVVNETMVMEGMRAGMFGLLALFGIWVLGFLFIRVPRQVRRAAAERGRPQPPNQPPPAEEPARPRPPDGRPGPAQMPPSSSSLHDLATRRASGDQREEPPGHPPVARRPASAVRHPRAARPQTDPADAHPHTTTRDLVQGGRTEGDADAAPPLMSIPEVPPDDSDDAGRSLSHLSDDDIDHIVDQLAREEQDRREKKEGRK